MKFILVLTILSTIACATPSKFVHATKSDEDFDRDSTNCDVKVNQAGLNGTLRARQFYNKCMSGEGWKRQ